jgi:ketosteroid isomerase-like protein
MKNFLSLFFALTLLTFGVNAQTDALSGGSSDGTSVTEHDALVDQFTRSFEKDFNSADLSSLRKRISTDIVHEGLDGTVITGADNLIKGWGDMFDSGKWETTIRNENIVRTGPNTMVVTGSFRSVDKSSSDASSNTRRGTFRNELKRDNDGNLTITRMKLHPAIQ